MEPNPSYYQDDEITLKELILKLQEYWRELWANWLIIGLLALPVLGFFMGKAFLSPITYPAKLTFMVNEDEGMRLGGLTSMLGQFGLGGGGGGKYNLDKIVELARSRQILERVIISKADYKGQEDFLGNHIIREYEIHEEWEKDTTGLKGFLFTHGEWDKFSIAENKALLRLYSQMVGSSEQRITAIYNVGYNDDTGIFTLTISGKTQDLSLLLANTVYQQLNQYYIDKTTEKFKITTEYARAKVDTLERLLNSRQYQLLQFEDRQQGLVMRTAEAGKFKIQRDLGVFGAAYGEAIKNLEIAEFAYRTATPFWQVIDRPIAPLKPRRETSKKKALLMGVLLGGFLGATFVIGRKIYREAMAEG